MIVDIMGKPTGTINREKKHYVTRRHRKRHYFRKHKGYGMSISILSHIKSMGISRVILIEVLKDRERLYETTVDKFYTDGIRHKNKEADQQLILPITEWRERKDGN